MMRITKWFLLALAAGCLALTVHGEPVTAAVPVTNAEPFAHVRIVGPEGKPLMGALVEPQGVSSGGGTSWGGTQGFAEQYVTGTNGEVMLTRKEPFTRVQVGIHVRGLAPANLWLEATNTVQTIELGVGSTLRGRVLQAGKLLAGVRVGVSGSDRSSEVYAGHYATKTGSDGVFAFEHLPPNIAWSFYGMIGSLKSYGALPARLVQSAGHGETNDLGDLTVVPGLRLAGKVQTRHGEPLPKGLKVILGYANTWDSQTATVDAEGRFAFEGLFKGELDMSLDPRNWQLTSANRSLDLWNPWRMSGRLEQDKDDLLLITEKGEVQYNYSGSSGNGQLPSADWPQNRPIQGAEPGSGPIPILLAGQVLDDKTGQPIPQYKVVPGRQPPVTVPPTGAKPVLQQILEPFSKKTTPWNERPFWDYPHTETFSNANFSIEFIRLTSTPMLRVEAEGYQPVETEPMNALTTNLVIRLKRGAGPNGVVLLPDGKPAEQATIIYAASQEQFSLSGRTLSAYGNREGQTVTGKDGKFSFPRRPHGLTLFISHPAGWAEESVEHGGDNLKVRLKPWAVVSGVLLDTNGVPLSGVTLALTMQRDWQSGIPFVNVQGQTKTDSKGYFRFSDVPPRRLELQRIIPMKNGWSDRLQTWFVAQPGITNDLGKVTYDTPPPPPMLDQIKQKLGL
jgi:protocatechuate 3,4-dioxygenase beta subunit